MREKTHESDRPFASQSESSFGVIFKRWGQGKTFLSFAPAGRMGNHRIQKVEGLKLKTKNGAQQVRADI
jgi:hypothetical protein